nr:MAG TPA: hypothetical protein [Caudoviricetes sp.]
MGSSPIGGYVCLSLAGRATYLKWFLNPHLLLTQ